MTTTVTTIVTTAVTTISTTVFTTTTTITTGLHLGFDDWYGLEILQNLKLEILQKIMRDFRQI